MSAMRRAAATAVLLFVVAQAPRGWAQSQDGESALRSLSVATEALRVSLGDPALIARIDQHVLVLDRARSAGLGGRLSPQYSDSLLADAALLEQAARLLGAGNRSSALRAVTDAEADLAVKRAHVEAGVGFSGGGLRTVRVTVRTVRGTQEERGHVVWFVARGWASDPRRYARFDEMSSPTSALLAPGNYVMWPGEASGGGREPIAVGGNGLSQQTVDLRLR